MTLPAASTLARLADALVADLNDSAAAWPEAFIATRRFHPQFEPRELDTLHVTVVPSAMRRGGGDRRGPSREIDLDLAVQQRLPAGPQQDEPRIGQLLALVEAIDQALVRSALDAMPDAFCTDSGFEPIYAPAHLDQYRVFTAVLQLTFRILTPGT